MLMVIAKWGAIAEATPLLPLLCLKFTAAKLLFFLDVGVTPGCGRRFFVVNANITSFEIAI